jgi:hypothetical protein
MTAKQLRAAGWLVFFRDEWVICYKGTHLKNALRLPVNNGEWMEKAEDPGNWQQFLLTGSQRLELMALQKVCYCSSLGDGNCDFCTQTRRHELEDTIKKMTLGLENEPFVFPTWSVTVSKANPSRSMKQPTIETLNQMITDSCAWVRKHRRSIVILWDDNIGEFARFYLTTSSGAVDPDAVYATIVPRFVEQLQSFEADIAEGPATKSLPVQPRA